MSAVHLEVLAEEPSMEAFLQALLPRLLPGGSFVVHPFRGKADLLRKLEDRLRAYAAWLPDDWRIIVVVDRDDDDCRKLKERLEHSAERAGLRSRARAGGAPWKIVNRIAVEELEAWYFGDWETVRTLYPRVPKHIRHQPRFRDPDAIAGGTWEAFERILRRGGYFKAGLPKIEVARAMGAAMDPSRCRSHSFRIFCEAIAEAVA